MELPKRKSNRLKNYDYSNNGAYFITLCAHNHENLFGEIVGDSISIPIVAQSVGEGSSLPQCVLNSKGNIIDEYINKIPLKFNTIKIDNYVIMPNHIHLIVFIDNGLHNSGTENPSPTVGKVIGWFKHQTTKQINELNQTIDAKWWQRSYHDHIIRNEQSYKKIWEYVDNNVLSWELDILNLNNSK